MHCNCEIDELTRLRTLQRRQNHMTRFRLTSIIALIMAALIFAYSQTRPAPQTRTTTEAPQLARLEKEVSTQQRINRYFHGDLMTKLKNCWSSLRGTGSISMKYTYA